MNIILAFMPTRSEPSTSTETSSLQLLEAPRFHVGKSHSIIRISPPGLRFWDKLGLSPQGGKKNILAFTLFQSKDQSKVSQVDNWMSNIGDVYEVFFHRIQDSAVPKL